MQQTAKSFCVSGIYRLNCSTPAYPGPVCTIDSHLLMSMLPPIPSGSVTGNLRRAQDGDDLAFEWLWHRYYNSLVRHLEKLASESGFDPVDPEDVAQSVFIAFHEGLSREKFHSLNGRYQLWKLLTLIGLRKAINSAKKDLRDRQSLQHSAAAGLMVIEQRFHGNCHDAQIDKAFDDLRFEEEIEHGLSLLDKELPGQRLRELALLKIKGYSNAGIAAEFGWTRKTVALRLNLIFEIWKEASEV